MAYAFILAKRISSAASVKHTASFVFGEGKWEKYTPRAKSREHYISKSSGEVLSKLRSRLRTLYFRLNATNAIQYEFQASSSWFAGKTKSQMDDFFNRARAFLENLHGIENVIYFGMLYDENPPRAEALVVPITADGKLNASAFIVPAKFRAIARDWVDTLADIGFRHLGTNLDLEQRAESQTSLANINPGCTDADHTTIHIGELTEEIKFRDVAPPVDPPKQASFRRFIFGALAIVTLLVIAKIATARAHE